MPNTIEELAYMMAKRDGLSFEEEMDAIRITAIDMQTAFFNGDLDLAEDILASDLGLEPDYIFLFIT